MKITQRDRAEAALDKWPGLKDYVPELKQRIIDFAVGFAQDELVRDAKEDTKYYGGDW